MTFELSTEPLTILADRGKLTTALINLLTNAREACDSRGEVSVTVSRSGSKVLIEVRDSGRGMTQEHAQRSIEPFFSTKTGTLATGLGLSRVFGFVEQTGGRLEIDSSPDVGTTVTLVFAITNHEEGRDPASIGPNVVPQHVLLVDDNEDVRKMVEKMLVTLGHTVMIAADGESALKLLTEDPPDLLITDVLMPGKLGGRELAQAVRKRQPSLPILMISGFAEATDLDFPLLSKPFRLADLEQALTNLFPIQQASNRL